MTVFHNCYVLVITEFEKLFLVLRSYLLKAKRSWN